MKSRRAIHTRTVIALLAVGALLGGACGGGESSSDSDATSQDDASGTAGSAPGIAGGTLSYGAFSDIPSFDPHLTQNLQSTYVEVPYDTLTAQDADGNVASSLATKWEAPSPATWRFTLRDDVTFTDGSAFNADVVKANIDRAKSTAGNPNAATFASIEDVTVVDDTTVEVTFTLANPGFPLEMSLVQGAMISGKAIADGTDLTRDPQGSGGWIRNADQSEDGVVQVFDKNPDYWNPDAQLVDQVKIYTFQDNNARRNALDTGVIQVMEAVNAADIPDLGKTYNVSSINNDFHFLLLTDRNGDLVPALGDEKVQEAIGLALDQDKYNAAIAQGQALATGGLFSSDSPWHDPALDDYNRADLVKAKQLLADAGYPDGFAMQIPSVPVIQAACDAIAQLLGEIGIQVEVVQLQPGQHVPALRKGDFPAAWVPHRQTDPQGFWKVWVTNNGPFNPFGLDDTAEIDGIAVEAATASGDEQKKLYDQMQKMILDAHIVFPLIHSPLSVALSNDVSGFTQYRGEMSGPPLGVSVGS